MYRNLVYKNSIYCIMNTSRQETEDTKMKTLITIIILAAALYFSVGQAAVQSFSTMNANHKAQIENAFNNR